MTGNELQVYSSFMTKRKRARKTDTLRRQKERASLIPRAKRTRRQRAVMEGRKTYRGKPCTLGHTTRRVLDMECVTCDTLWSKIRRAKQLIFLGTSACGACGATREELQKTNDNAAIVTEKLEGFNSFKAPYPWDMKPNPLRDTLIGTKSRSDVRALLEGRLPRGVKVVCGRCNGQADHIRERMEREDRFVAKVRNRQPDDD